MKRSGLVYILVFATAVLLFAIPSHAQVTTGSISGSVIDPTGAAVAGATVSAKNTQTGAPEVTQTNETGYFKLGFLPVGTYDVSISKSGFRTEKISAAQVQVNADNNLAGITLQLGAETATVEVTAAPPMIESTTAQITNTFTDQQITSFAGVQEQEGLDFLALQVPGVVTQRY